jgi:predicted transcriptional regulator
MAAATATTSAMATIHEYRDRIYIRKDIMLKLSEYGELNQSKLMIYCGLNNVKHREIIDDMVEKGLVTRFDESWGAKKVVKCRISEKGREILRQVLEPYEALFPRGTRKKSSSRNFARLSKTYDNCYCRWTPATAKTGWRGNTLVYLSLPLLPLCSAQKFTAKPHRKVREEELVSVAAALLR